MAAITEANAKLMRHGIPTFRQLARRGNEGWWKWIQNFDDTSGALLTAVGTALTGTSADSFTLASGETDGKFVISVNTTGTNHSVTLKAPVTSQAVTLTLPDIAADTLVSKTSTDTLTNKTLTTPTIADFSNATHTHATAAQGGALSLPSLSGTSMTTFTINTDGAAAKLAFSSNSATGAFTATVVVPNLSAAATITLPAVTSTLAVLGANTFTAAQTFGAGIVASGAVSNNFSGGSGTFLTSTGANTLSGDVTISGSKTLTTGTGAVALNGSVTIAATKTLTFTKGAGASIIMNGETSGGITISPAAVGTSDLTLVNPSCAAPATITLPNATCTLPGLGLANSFTAAQSILVDSSATATITDVLTLRSSTTGTAATNIGVGLAFQVEDSDAATTEQGSIDVIVVDVGTAGATVDADMSIKLRKAGTSTEILRLVSDVTGSGGASMVQIGADAAAASLELHPATTASGTLRFTAANSATDSITLITNASQAAARTYTIPDAGASASFAMTQGAQTLVGVQTLSAAPIVHISNTDTTQVADCLTLKHETSATPAAGLGVGISFQITDLTGATVEEQGSIDFKMAVVTSTAEDCNMVVSLNTDGDITQAFKLDAENNKAVFGVASDVGSISSIQIYPSSATAKGSLTITMTANTGDSATTITNAAQGGAYTYTIPDAGATANFLMSQGAQTVVGVNTFTGSSVIVANATTPILTIESGMTNTGYVQVKGKTSGMLKIMAADSTAQTVTFGPAAQTSGAGSATIPDLAGGAHTFDLIGLAQTISAIKTYTAAPVVSLDDTTDGVVTGLTLRHSSSDNVPTIGDGVKLSFHLEQATPFATEEWANITAASVTLTNGAEDCDVTISTMIAGTVTQALKIDTTNEQLVIGSDATNTEGINKIRIYPQTAASGSLILQAAVDASGDHATTLTNSTLAAGAVTATLPAFGGQLAAFTATATTVAGDDLTIPVTHGIVAKTTANDGEVLTLAAGVPGQVIVLYLTADGGGDGVLTPGATAHTGFTTITFATAKQSATLLWVDASIGWTILGTVGNPTVA